MRIRMMRRSTPLILFAAFAILLLAGNAFAWSFAVCGDSRDDKNGILVKILSEIDKSPMEFLIHTGDLERGGGEKRWSGFRKKTAGFTKPLHFAIGNHEIYGGGSSDAFVRFFGLPAASYSFDHKDAHVAILDNDRGNLDGDMIAWLDNDLASHPKGKTGIRHLIVAMHVPPKTDTLDPHGTPDDYGDMSNRLFKVLKRHGVALVLCSHEHMHQIYDWNGIKVIVSGGAGAPMYPFQRYGYYEIDLSDDTPHEIFHAINP